MKMYIRLLFLAFWCWKRGISMGIDNSINGYYVVGFRNSKNNRNFPQLCYVISVKPCRDPYIICNKLRRDVYQKMILKRGKARIHKADFIQYGLRTFC